MRRAAALLLALLAAAPASAATFTVTSDGTMTNANASAVAGDVVNVFPASYTVGINPARGGTDGAYIRYVGKSADKVLVPSISFNSKRCVSVNNFRTLRWIGNLANRDSLLNSAVYDTSISFSIGTADSIVIARDSISVRGLFFTCFADDCSNPANNRPAHNRSLATRWYLSPQTSTEDPIRFRGPQFWRSDSSYYLSCRNPVAADDVRSFISYYAYQCSWNADTLDLLNRKSNDQQGVYMREHTTGNAFRNVYIRHHPSSVGSTTAGWFFGSGAAPGTTGSDSLINCTISVPGDAVSFGNDGSNCYLYGNSLYSWQGNAVDVNSFGGAVFADSIRFEHNTCLSGGSGVGGQSVHFEDGSATLPQTWRSNIFIRVDQGTGGAESKAHFRLQGGRAQISSDYNLYWSLANDDSANVIYYAGAGYSHNSGSGWSLVSPFPDAHSRFGDPQLADTSRYSMDFTPAVGGNAFGSWWPDGYVGAISTGAAPGGDLDPPGTVTDLDVSATGPTSAVLGWTANGDDGFTGTADTVLVRRAASAINSESAWNSATVISAISGGAQSPGGEPQVEFSTGLTAGSTVFFAVRARDDAGNLSGISNSPSITLGGAPDVTPPSVISNLTATRLTPYSIRLTWTAPGNDGASGTAANYRIKRRAGTTFVLADSAAATVVTPPAPQVAGTVQSVDVGGLAPSTAYAFAMWTADAAGNTATISNAATATTEGLPAVAAAASNRRRRR